MIEKLKKFLYKCRYITEFINTVIFIFFLVQIIYTKAYNGYIHKLYLLGGIIWFSILLINIIYNIKKSNKKVEKLFLNFVIPLGICFSIFMIPGHVPDENTHFYKAYDISCGNLVTKINDNGESYITVPKDLVLSGENTITFVYSGETYSPLNVGESSDARNLGLGFRNVSLTGGEVQ